MHSIPVKAGKRTYFFDVKATRGNDYFLCITESKRIMERSGHFVYEKHKVFIYKEDLNKFLEGLTRSIDFIHGNKGDDYSREEFDGSHPNQEPSPESNEGNQPGPDRSNMSFDDLD